MGAAYIKSKEAKPTEILTDLLDMVKGIQQSTRGLFVRFYLLKSVKDILPDLGNEFTHGDEDVKDSIDFILKNLSEMNRLWIRL